MTTTPESRAEAIERVVREQFPHATAEAISEIVAAAQTKLSETGLRHRIARLEVNIRSERAWIRDHGGNQAGYIARYGSAQDPEHYGDGGEAIYAADANALARLESEYESLTGQKP